MAAQTLAVQTVSRAGVTPTKNGGLSTGDTYGFVNDGKTALKVVNGGGSDCTVTIPLTETVDGQTPASKTVVVAAGTEKVIGPFPKAHYNNAAGSLLGITFSFITSVTVELYSVG